MSGFDTGIRLLVRPGITSFTCNRWGKLLDFELFVAFRSLTQRVRGVPPESAGHFSLWV